MKLSLNSHVVQLSEIPSAGLTSVMAKKLAVAVASHACKPDWRDATIEDLLSYFPMRYEDRSNFLPIDRLVADTEATVELYVRVSGGYKVGKNRGPKAPPLFIFEISAGDVERRLKPVVIWWFVSGRGAQRIISYYENRFPRGTRLVAFGKWEWDSRRNTFSLRLAKPDELEILPSADDLAVALPIVEDASGHEAIDDDLDDDAGDPALAIIHSGRHVPVYRKLGPFRTKRLRELIFSVIENLDPESVPETLPESLRTRHRLVSRFRAIREIHFPPDGADLKSYFNARSDAHIRLIFEEFFWVSFALELQRGERKKEPKGTLIEISDVIRTRMNALPPFDLTSAQDRVLAKILDDLTSDAPMNRLVQGDVGSGKTIVALMAMFAAMENGYQAALMAPTEILAEQHFRNASRLFADTPYRVGLLVGSLKAAEKRKMQELVATGEVHAVVGTHAIIQDAVSFDKLGLAVIDEQHRFGVLQRAELRERGYNPDILVMTATPIPRSLAMTVYGDLDVSVIDELPPGRTPVKTVVVGEDKRDGVYRGIDREIGLGRQVYIVYPLIKESEKLDLKAATEMFEQLRDKVFPQYRVGLLHGRMKPAEKEETMRDFSSGELNILVSTTVIEVGVDVPNASLMVIEHAERFGLSQLHQLRGRVGRGAEQSYCVLLTGDKRTAVARERLGIMEDTSDGFKIAEKDLEIRGQGDILGTRQAGVEAFRIGNIIRDISILEDARREAEFLLENQRRTSETGELISRVRDDARFRLGVIG